MASFPIVSFFVLSMLWLQMSLAVQRDFVAKSGRLESHHTWTIDIRGGHINDEYDDLEDEYDVDLHEHTSRPQARQSSREPGSRVRRKERNTRGRGTSKPPSMLTKLATSSLSLSRKAAVGTITQSGKAAYYLTRPKSISESEIWGLWRLDQQVTRGLEILVCKANVEFTKRQEIVIQGHDDSRLWRSFYRWFSPPWPQSCRVEFEARAFAPDAEGSSNKKRPWLLFYKGYLQRKVADPSVIKMVGKLYRIERPKGMFGKQLPDRHVAVGSFVGRRRVAFEEEWEDDDEYDDDEYEEDGDDEYEDEDKDEDDDAEL